MILVINVNISLVGLMFLPSMFQKSSTMECHGLEDVEPLQYAKDIELAQAQSSGLYIFYFSVSCLTTIKYGLGQNSTKSKIWT